MCFSKSFCTGVEAAQVFTISGAMRAGFCVNIVIAIGAGFVTDIIIHKQPTTINRLVIN
jgi:hypothetical protein